MFSAFFRYSSRFFIAFAVSAVFFLAIPISNYIQLSLLQPAKIESVPIQMQKVAAPKKKKTPPKKRQIVKKTRSKTRSAPKGMARSQLAMDLGPGGNGGAEIGQSGDAAPMALEEGEVDISPQLMQPAAPPAYPKAAQQAGVTGTVLVQIVINESGKVSNIQILESPGDYGFEEEIRKAMSRWNFKPAMLKGVPVSFKLQYPFEF